MWFVYLLECSDSSYYIGITTDVDARLAVHNTGRGSKYTRGRRPCKVVKTIEAADRSEASKIEAAWKKVKREKKREFRKETK